MRTPSRKMPKAPEVSWLGAMLVLGFVVLMLVALATTWWPLAILVSAVIACMSLIDSRRNRKITEERRGESICQFARGFDCRTIDTWIIRAVYEEFAGAFPLRASDRFKEDLRTDSDDLDFGVIHIARRTGRSLDEYERNPMFGKIDTLRDLVMFFHHQPLLSSPQVRQQR
jgi:hypothetical protein